MFSSGNSTGEVGAAGSSPFNAFDVGAGGASTCGISSLELGGSCSGTVILTTSGAPALEDEGCAARDAKAYLRNRTCCGGGFL